MKHCKFAVLALVAASACVPVLPEIRNASASGGDFTLLSCSQLATAEGSLRQRLSALDAGETLSLNVVSPTGQPAAERRMIVNSAAQEMAALRVRRNCAESAPIVTAAEVLAQPEPVSEPAPVATAAAQPAATSGALRHGRYLQVATFELTENRDAALTAFRQRGVNANSQPVMLAGRQHHRILVGPLNSREDIRQADAVSRSLGLRDAFFVNE